MKILCDASLFYNSIFNQQEKDEFKKHYGSPDKFFNGIYVSLPNDKTLSQNALIWRDWSEVARLLYTTKETIYWMLLRADEFVDVWTEKVNGAYRVRTLSALNKQETSEFIPRYRDYLQEFVNQEYGEWTAINWSQSEKE